MQLFKLAMLLLLLAPLFLIGGEQPENESGYTTKPAIVGSKMMVVSANPWASQAGYEILQQGGNAIDAVIAMQMVLTVVEPQSSGIGGGAFLLYYQQKTKKVSAYDGREAAPKEVSEDLFIGDNGSPMDFHDALVGGKSVGVPGVIKMLELAHQEQGKLSWESLFAAAIKKAEKGFSISPRLHKLIAATPKLRSFPETEAYFFEGEKAKEIGTWLKNLDLAATFRLISQQGSRVFYEGEIAEAIANAVQKAPVNPGSLSLEDLAAYRAIKREPLQTRYHDYEIYGFPPPSGGGIAIAQMMKMLEYANVKALQPNDLSFIQLFTEASRLAFADRNYYVADPDFFSVPTKKLLKSTYLQSRGKLLDPFQALEIVSHGDWPGKGKKCCPALHLASSLEFPSTTHLCVVDADGNVASMTSSIENAFGSTLFVKGFFLNNQMTDFAFASVYEGTKAANRIEPGKRPMSSMSPTLVFDSEGEFVLAAGSAGGSRIVDYVAQTLLGVLTFGLNIQEAIDYPHYTALSAQIDLEKGTFLEQFAPQLETRGNPVNISALTSGTHGIQKKEGKLIGGVDPRREGEAIGE